MYTSPYNTYPPPPPPRKHHLWRWLLLALALLFVGIICAISTPAFMQGWSNGLATQTATHATPSPAQSARMGGSLDAFESAYGLPTRTAPSSETFTSNKIQITAYVNTAQVVIRVFVTGIAAWNVNDDYTYCKQFLPLDASEFHRVVTSTPAFVDYHSSLGDITMQLQTPTCLLFIDPS